MKIEKNTPIDRKIKEVIKKIEKNMLVKCETNINSDFQSIFFSGSGFIIDLYVEDFEINSYTAKEEVHDRLSKKFRDEETIKLFIELKTYIDWKKTEERINKGYNI